MYTSQRRRYPLMYYNSLLLTTDSGTWSTWLGVKTFLLRFITLIPVWSFKKYVISKWPVTGSRTAGGVGPRGESDRGGSRTAGGVGPRGESDRVGSRTAGGVIPYICYIYVLVYISFKLTKYRTFCLNFTRGGQVVVNDSVKSLFISIYGLVLSTRCKYYMCLLLLSNFVLCFTRSWNYFLPRSIKPRGPRELLKIRTICIMHV